MFIINLYTKTDHEVKVDLTHLLTQTFSTQEDALAYGVSESTPDHVGIEIVDNDTITTVFYVEGKELLRLQGAVRNEETNSFWDGLKEDLENPDFFEKYEKESDRIERLNSLLN